MKIYRNIPLIEKILDEFKPTIGVDFDGYKNHVYRVVNLCYAAGELSAEDEQKIQIAACFHDIGIWTDATLDYLPPSEKTAAAYLTAESKDSWIPEISAMIVMHHCINSCRDSDYPLVEIFRRADIADFSLGLFPMDMSRALISMLKSEFPNKGFHRRLFQLGCSRMIKHPLNPLPMFRA